MKEKSNLKTNLTFSSSSLTSKDSGMIDGGSTSSVSASSNPHPPSSSSTGASLTQRLASLNFGDRNKGEHRRNFSLPTRGSSAGAGSTSGHARTSSGSGNVDLNSSLSSLNQDEWIDLVRSN